MNVWIPDWLYSKFPGLCIATSGGACLLGTALAWTLGVSLFLYASSIMYMRMKYVSRAI